ncbi:hypothetical protein EG327_007195 [Venturia inaequalis]|uniref:Ferric oxidoreductase domain-containing protein n=1 Tax=Venturia inaequalis TaxID=5025 RepID=A0A8H3V228_VENIN|nr:hypothetical protein EG327_007195 [Venturia inaequalis]
MRLPWKKLMITLGAIVSVGRAKDTGLIGYGINRWQPRCAFSCQNALTSSPLACTIFGPGPVTTRICYASDEAYLGSLAWCIQSRCDDLPLWQDEEWWTTMATGDPKMRTTWSFSQALPETEPNITMVRMKPLKLVSKVSDRDYQKSWNAYAESERVEKEGSKYAIIFVCIGVIMPIALSLLRFVPMPKVLITKITSYLITPATWGTKHRQPLANLGFCPTRGQSLFISLLTTLNLIFCFTKYPAEYVPFGKQARYRTRSSQVLVIMANRFAAMCLANLSLLVLYAGRNNILLWATKWQRETFLLFHHWLGYMTIICGAVHAILFLYSAVKSGRYAEEHKELFWKFGIVAIVAFASILPQSILPIRVRAYEIFLASHRILSFLALAAVFVHIYVESSDTGLHNWVYAALAALALEYLMRALRLFRNGIKEATITVVDEDYLRVDVPGVTAEGHAYIYFPTLTWRFWDNHPFSVAASFHDAEDVPVSRTVLPLQEVKRSETTREGPKLPLSISKEVSTGHTPSPMTSTPPSTVGQNHGIPTAGLTFFIRRREGLTVRLASRTKVPVLIESSYGSLHSLRTHPNLIAIAGGVGIVTVLPLLRTHPGRSKLYWGLRTPGLLDALTNDLRGIDKEVFIGQRMDVRAVLEQELSGDRAKGAVVVVSGPPGLADDVRAIVSELGRQKDAWPVKLVDESFG